MNIAYGERARQAGITLIELMIVLLIIAVITAVGYPSYQSFVRDSKRTDAHTLLQRIASAQEQFFSNNNTYTADLTALGMADPEPSDEGYWEADVTIGTGSYTITAVTSATYEDPDCGEILLTSLGEKRSRESEGDATLNPPGTCW